MNRIVLGSFAALFSVSVLGACAQKDVATPEAIIEDSSIGYGVVTIPFTQPKSDKDCPATDGSAPQKRTFTAEPPLCIDMAKGYVATMETSEGSMTFDLLNNKAPHAVNSFVFLARQKYFDGLTIHRDVKDFVFQGGDPKGDGSGGPGYTFPDELPDAGEYLVGSLVMANAGPNTNGSQFFVVTGANGVALPPNYAFFGQVQKGKGEDTIQKINALSNAADGPPTKAITINKVTISETATPATLPPTTTTTLAPPTTSKTKAADTKPAKSAAKSPDTTAAK